MLDIVTLGAPIITLEYLYSKRIEFGKIVAVSGGFDPIHPGHISYIQEAKKLGDTLVVIVNGDTFLRDKKGKPFQDLKTRCTIVSSIRGIDFVAPFEIENDPTVCHALEILKPHIRPLSKLLLATISIFLFYTSSGFVKIVSR